MGKKSRKTKSKIGHHWINTDGSNPFAQTDDNLWVGGQAHYIGHSPISDKNERRGRRYGCPECFGNNVKELARHIWQPTHPSSAICVRFILPI